jgi:hypothetical protein
MAFQAISRPGRFLADHRLRLSLSIAVVEAFLVLVDVLPNWTVFALAAIAVGFWVTAGRSYKSNTVRQASWIFAASQVLAVLVPVLLIFVKTVAYVVIAILAILALVFLITERDRQPEA